MPKRKTVGPRVVADVELSILTPVSIEMRALFPADCAPMATTLFICLPCSKGSGKLIESNAVSLSAYPGDS